MKIYSILDKKALFYSTPFFYINNGIALRGFQELVNDEKTSLNKYPADFSLWLIGSYDEKMGLLTPLSKPEFVQEAVNVITKEK